MIFYGKMEALFMVDKQLISDIKNSVNIVDVIGEVVQLTKAGRNFLGLCPFHGEKHHPLMSLKTNSFIIVLVVDAQAMYSSLLKTIEVSPLWKQSKS